MKMTTCSISLIVEHAAGGVGDGFGAPEPPAPPHPCRNIDANSAEDAAASNFSNSLRFRFFIVSRFDARRYRKEVGATCRIEAPTYSFPCRSVEGGYPRPLLQLRTKCDLRISQYDIVDDDIHVHVIAGNCSYRKIPDLNASNPR